MVIMLDHVIRSRLDQQMKYYLHFYPCNEKNHKAGGVARILILNNSIYCCLIYNNKKCLYVYCKWIQSELGLGACDYFHAQCATLPSGVQLVQLSILWSVVLMEVQKIVRLCVLACTKIRFDECYGSRHFLHNYIKSQSNILKPISD